MRNGSPLEGPGEGVDLVPVPSTVPLCIYNEIESETQQQHMDMQCAHARPRERKRLTTLPMLPTHTPYNDVRSHMPMPHVRAVEMPTHELLARTRRLRGCQ